MEFKAEYDILIQNYLFPANMTQLLPSKAKLIQFYIILGTTIPSIIAMAMIITIMEDMIFLVFLLLKLNIAHLFPERILIMLRYFFLVLPILCLILMHHIKRTKRISEQENASFWKREAEADNVRKQDISNLDYIYIPIETLPFGIDASPEAQRAEATLRELDSTQILNLSAYTNTDLKMKYGVANLNTLSECDDRFTTLVRTLYQWACLLLEHGHREAAIRVAEYSVEIGSDISGIYYMLTDYYQFMDDGEAMARLQKSANSITSLNAKLIKDYINKSKV